MKYMAFSKIFEFRKIVMRRYWLKIQKISQNMSGRKFDSILFGICTFVIELTVKQIANAFFMFFEDFFFGIIIKR